MEGLSLDQNIGCGPEAWQAQTIFLFYTMSFPQEPTKIKVVKEIFVKVYKTEKAYIEYAI